MLSPKKATSRSGFRRVSSLLSMVRQSPPRHAVKQVVHFLGIRLHSLVDPPVEQREETPWQNWACGRSPHRLSPSPPSEVFPQWNAQRIPVPETTHHLFRTVPTPHGNHASHGYARKLLHWQAAFSGSHLAVSERSSGAGSQQVMRGYRLSDMVTLCLYREAASGCHV
jgi:hypothetical protein